MILFRKNTVYIAETCSNWYTENVYKFILNYWISKLTFTCSLTYIFCLLNVHCNRNLNRWNFSDETIKASHTCWNKMHLIADARRPVNETTYDIFIECQVEIQSYFSYSIFYRKISITEHNLIRYVFSCTGIHQ